MGGEGHMLDMIRRLSEGREASRLRRERTSDKLNRLNRTSDPYPQPNTTPEEMERIIRYSKKKKTVITSCGERSSSWVYLW